MLSAVLCIHGRGYFSLGTICLPVSQSQPPRKTGPPDLNGERLSTVSIFLGSVPPYLCTIVFFLMTCCLPRWQSRLPRKNGSTRPKREGGSSTFSHILVWFGFVNSAFHTTHTTKAGRWATRTAPAPMAPAVARRPEVASREKTRPPPVSGGSSLDFLYVQINLACTRQILCYPQYILGFTRAHRRINPIYIDIDIDTDIYREIDRYR